MSAVKMYDIRWVSHTAGPSPVKTKFSPNARVELFFAGCKKAASGNPCKDCFNPTLWFIPKGAKELDPKEMAVRIEKFAPQKYITIVGGEALDQPEGLTVLCEELRKRNFHIIVFTHYTLIETFDRWSKTDINKASVIEGWTYDLFIRFLKSIDILIDGEYESDKRIYDESLQDGFHNAIGSSNQIVWDLKAWRDNNFKVPVKGQISANILQFTVKDEDNSLMMITKDNSCKEYPLLLIEK